MYCSNVRSMPDFSCDGGGGGGWGGGGLGVRRAGVGGF